MATDTDKTKAPRSAAAKSAADERKERLAKALRDNLRRRKEQDRAREEGEPDR